MIQTKIDLKYYLMEDFKSINYKGGALSANKFLPVLLLYDYSLLYHFFFHLRYAEFNHNRTDGLKKLNKIKYLYHSWKMRLYSKLIGCPEIPINTIGYGVKIPHVGKIIINTDAKVGNYCTIYPGVCIGKKNGSTPVVGDNVFIGLGVYILGNVNIGDGAILAPNSVVLHSVKENEIVAGSPAHLVKINLQK